MPPGISLRRRTAIVPAAATGAAETGIETRYESTDARFTFSSGWSTDTSGIYSGGTTIFTQLSAKTCSIAFRGSRLKLIGGKDNARGKANMALDGGAPTLVDLYQLAATYNVQIFDTGVLAFGNHTLLITTTGTANPSSFGTFVDIDAADITE